MWAFIALTSCSSDDEGPSGNIPVDIIYFYGDPVTADLFQVEILGDTNNTTLNNLKQTLGLNSSTRISQVDDRLVLTLGGSEEGLLFERSFSNSNYAAYSDICEQRAIFSPNTTTEDFIAVGSFDDTGRPIIEIVSKRTSACESLAVGEVGDLFGGNTFSTFQNHVIFYTVSSRDGSRTLYSVDVSARRVVASAPLANDDYFTMRQNQVLSFHSDGTYSVRNLNLELQATAPFDYYGFLPNFRSFQFQTQFSNEEMLLLQSTPQPFAIAYFPFVVDLSSNRITTEAEVASDVFNVLFDLDIPNRSAFGNFISNLEAEVFVIPVTLFFSDDQTFGTGFVIADFDGNILSNFSLPFPGAPSGVFVN